MSSNTLDYKSCMQKALKYYKNKKYGKAIVYFEKSKVFDEKSPAYNHIGACYMMLNQQDQALEAFQRALELDESSHQAMVNIGNIYKEKKKFDFALQFYKRALELASDKPSYWFNIGVVYKEAKKYKKAFDYLHKAVELDATYVKCWMILAQTYEAMLDFENAKSCYLQATSSDPKDSASWFCLATLYLQENDLSEAITSLNEAVRVKPSWSKAHHKLGQVYSMLGNYEEALTSMDKSINSDPTFHQAFYGKGLILLENGNIDGALTCLKSAEELHPSNRYKSAIMNAKELKKSKITHLGELTFLKELRSYISDGNGNSTKIYKVELKDEKKLTVAVKFVLPTDNSYFFEELFSNAVYMLSNKDLLPDHEFLIKQYTYFEDSLQNCNLSFLESKSVKFSLLNYRDHDLTSMINYRKLEHEHPPFFTTTEVNQLAKNLTQVVQHLANHGIVHRDVTLRNVIFTERFNINSIKLSGFEMAITPSNYHLSKDLALNFLNREYLAPEITQTIDRFVQADYSTCDMYMIGVILYKSIVGDIPLSPRVWGTTNSTSDLEIPDSKFAGIIPRLISENPNQRLTASGLLELLD